MNLKNKIYILLLIKIIKKNYYFFNNIYKEYITIKK
jgi:hypothetical protein